MPLNRIREFRVKAGLKAKDVAERLNVTPTTVSRWENGAQTPRTQELLMLSKLLKAESSELLGKELTENLEKVRPYNQIEMVEIPLLSHIAEASCGTGIGLFDLGAGTKKIILIPASQVGMIDPEHRPFAIYAAGNSMVQAGITNGSILVINPGETVRNGDVGFVIYSDECFAKWVIYKPNGDIELRSANPDYETILIDKEYAQSGEWFRVIGKVVSISRTPKSAFA